MYMGPEKKEKGIYHHLKHASWSQNMQLVSLLSVNYLEVPAFTIQRSHKNVHLKKAEKGSKTHNTLEGGSTPFGIINKKLCTLDWMFI